jgi:hypothetical protein
MSCTINNIAPVCTSLNSATKQNQALLLLLCQALKAITPATECDFDTQLALADEAGLLCLSVGQLRQKQAQIICDGLDVDCESLNCASLLEIEAVKTLLICELANDINP